MSVDYRNYSPVPVLSSVSAQRGAAALNAAANNGVGINPAQLGAAASVSLVAPAVAPLTLTPRVSGKFRVTVQVTGVTVADAVVTLTPLGNAAVLNNTVPPVAAVTSGGATHTFSLNISVITAAYALGVPVAFNCTVASGSNVTVAIGGLTMTAEELPA